MTAFSHLQTPWMKTTKRCSKVCINMRIFSWSKRLHRICPDSISGQDQTREKFVHAAKQTKTQKTLSVYLSHFSDSKSKWESPEMYRRTWYKSTYLRPQYTSGIPGLYYTDLRSLWYFHHEVALDHLAEVAVHIQGLIGSCHTTTRPMVTHGWWRMAEITTDFNQARWVEVPSIATATQDVTWRPIWTGEFLPAQNDANCIQPCSYIISCVLYTYTLRCIDTFYIILFTLEHLYTGR